MLIYAHRTGFGQAPKWGARAHALPFRNSVNTARLANQPGADLAGMYVLQLAVATEQRRRNTTMGATTGLPGYVSFYDPRAGMNMNAIKRDPYHGYHQSLRPRAGLLLMWPAYVSYFLHPNLSQDPAMRVAFEVQMHPGPGSP